MDYHLIIIATPIWASTFAPPIRTFLSENNLSGKNIAILACNAGGGMGKCENDVKSLVPDAKIVGTVDLIEPLFKHSSDTNRKAIDWLKTLMSE